MIARSDGYPFTLILTVLMALTTLAVAEQKAQEKKLRPPAGAQEKTGTIKLDRPILQMTGKVTQVNPTAKTFTVMAKGQAVTFTAANLTLPKVGEILDITYTETPGGPMKATTFNNSKSNTYYYSVQ